jgi:hypothetical protein
MINVVPLMYGNIYAQILDGAMRRLFAAFGELAGDPGVHDTKKGRTSFRRRAGAGADWPDTEHVTRRGICVRR